MAAIESHDIVRGGQFLEHFEDIIHDFFHPLKNKYAVVPFIHHCETIVEYISTFQVNQYQHTMSLKREAYYSSRRLRKFKIYSKETAEFIN